MPVLPAKKTPKAKGKTTGDKIKLFEATPQEKRLKKSPKVPKTGNAFSRKLDKSIASMRKLFEISPGKVEAAVWDEKEGGLSMKNVQDIVSELQEDIEETSKIEERKVIKRAERWSAMTHDCPPSIGDGGAASTAMSLEMGELEMVIKEVECEMRQPKPLRLTEMKRMRLLCSGRGRSIADKEKKRVVDSRTLSRY